MNFPKIVCIIASLVLVLVATVTTNQLGWWDSSGQYQARIEAKDAPMTAKFHRARLNTAMALAMSEADLAKFNTAMARSEALLSAMEAIMEAIETTNNALDGGYIVDPSIEDWNTIMGIIDGSMHRIETAETLNLDH